MRHTRTLCVALLTGAAAVSFGFATQPDRSRNQSSPIIHRKMEQMAGAMEQLDAALNDGDTKVAYRQLQILQESIIDAKAQKPAITRQMEDEQAEATTTAFRKTMAELLMATCRLEITLADGDFEGAKSMMRDDIGNIIDAGHRDFNP